VRLVAVCSETSTSGSAASLWRIEPASEDDARLLRGGGGGVTLRLGDGAGVRLAAGGELEPLELHIDAAAEAVHGLFARRATDGAEAPERFLEGELEMLDELLQAEPNRFRGHAPARLPVLRAESPRPGMPRLAVSVHMVFARAALLLSVHCASREQASCSELVASVCVFCAPSRSAFGLQQVGIDDQGTHHQQARPGAPHRAAGE
jgi:hypothetical protein